MAKPSSHHFSKRRPNSKSYLHLPRLSFLVLLLCSILFILLQIPHLYLHFRMSTTTPLQKPWPLMHQFGKIIQATIQNLPIKYDYENGAVVERDVELESMAEKLRESVTFLPLKDLRYADSALQGHTWFMSSMNDTHDEGEVQYQHFPSEPSKGRVLCLKGRDTHDGSRNYYGLAWWGFLPRNATAMKGLTFVSYNHYNFDNIWHGLSATLPFVAWHQRKGCQPPDRWVLYHWGEIRRHMGMWLGNLIEATFGGPPRIEGFDRVEEGSPMCFEEAVVMRHNEGGMSQQRRMEAYDLMRCKARRYCNVSFDGSRPVIGLTMFMRTGARSFKNDSAVIEIFWKECVGFEECRLTVAYSNNLTFGVSPWRPVNEHVPHGQKQQRHGVLPQRLAKARRSRTVCLSLDSQLVRDETSRGLARSQQGPLSVPGGRTSVHVRLQKRQNRAQRDPLCGMG